MKIENFLKRVVALTLCVGALPFLNNASAYAGENVSAYERDSIVVEKPKDAVGFTYGAEVTMQTTYLWRGLYAGGPCIQASANVGYGGLYGLMWWNIGATDFALSSFLPEVDLILGFNRWGLNVYLLYIHNFNCKFFDFANYADKGNRLEIDASYTISKKIPLRILWATRIGAADGYYNAKGELVQAYSSYFEVSYTQALPHDMSLFGAIGFSPWRSLYTNYERNFAVANIDIQLRKDWIVSERCGIRLMGQVCLNPSALAADNSTVKWIPDNPGRQSVNANLGIGVYLR